jgi:type VI secretion system lysozyme-like protein
VQYLFERLANRQTDDRQQISREQRQLDVLRQIQCIVAARPWLDGDGSAGTEHLLSFGHTAVSDLARGNQQQLARYGERLKQLIQRYEPRLQQPSIELAPHGDPCSPLKVMVSGLLQADDGDDEAIFLQHESQPQLR